MIHKNDWFVYVQVIFDIFMATYHLFLILGEIVASKTHHKFYRSMKRLTNSMEVTLICKDMEEIFLDFYSKTIQKRFNHIIFGSSVLFSFIFLFSEPLYSICSIPFTLLIGIVSFLYYNIFSIQC